MCYFRECDKEGCACNTGTFYVLLCCGHSYHPELIALKLDTCPIGGTSKVLPSKEVRGLGPHIKFGGKLWGKVRPSSPNKRKNFGSSVTTRRRSWEKVPILGSYLKFRG